MQESGAVAAIGQSQLIDLVSSYASQDDAVERAKTHLRALSGADPEASAGEVGAALDETGWLRAGIVGGAATAAALAGGLFALRRRGGEQGDEAERVLESQSMSRRDMLSFIGLGVAGAGAGRILRTSEIPVAGAATRQVARSTGVPNVLAIVIDDLNDYPTYLGGCPMPVQTPNLDALAAESRTFINHHVTVPICPPSRATLMLGLDAQQHGLTAATLDHPQYRAFVDSSIGTSLPALARGAGVRTIGGGKVFHSDQYVDQWDDFVTTRPPTAAIAAGSGLFDFGPLLDDYNPDAELVSAMRDFLRTFDGSAPFLMVPGIRLPHLPWRVPQRFLDMYPLADVVVPETPEQDWDDLGPVAIAQLEQFKALYGKGYYEIVESRQERAQLMQAYVASMSHTDALVGDLLDELASSKFADDTVVVVVSDNGYHQGENFAYRKLTLRDQATKTPFLVRPVDGATFTPEVVDQVVSSTSFMPTVLDLLGVGAVPELRGVSVRDDVLPSEVVTTHVHNSVSLVYGDHREGGRWTLHFEPDQAIDPATVTIDDVAEMELYDRVKDPQEFDNLLPPKP